MRVYDVEVRDTTHSQRPVRARHQDEGFKGCGFRVAAEAGVVGGLPLWHLREGLVPPLLSHLDERLDALGIEYNSYGGAAV